MGPLPEEEGPRVVKASKVQLDPLLFTVLEQIAARRYWTVERAAQEAVRLYIWHVRNDEKRWQRLPIEPCDGTLGGWNEPERPRYVPVEEVARARRRRNPLRVSTTGPRARRGPHRAAKDATPAAPKRARQT